MAIDFYTPPYWELNNFSANAVEFDGHLYPTAEHAYQAAKFSDPKIQNEIRTAPSPREAKRIAHELHEHNIDPAWATNGGAKKLRVMEQILRAKLAQHPEIAALLVKSGSAKLVEGSPTDHFWGTGADGSGRNHLGKLWSALRAELQTPMP